MNEENKNMEENTEKKIDGRETSEGANESHKETGEVKPEVDNRTVMGILSYLGLLVIIPLLVSKTDPFVKFHIKQGLVLLVIEVILVVAQAVLGIIAVFLIPIFMIIGLGMLVLAILGIVNVVNKEEKQLPVVGKFGESFKI